MSTELIDHREVHPPMPRDLSTLFTDATHASDQYPATFNARGTSFIAGFDDLIEKIDRGVKVKFVADPANEYDSNAIRLVTEQDDFLGHMPAEMSRNTPKDIWNWYGVVHHTHSAGEGRNAGVTIRLMRLDTTPVLLDKDIPKANSEILNEELVSDFVHRVRDVIGYPESNSITDPLSPARLSNALRILVSEQVDISALIDEDSATDVDVLYMRNLVPVHLDVESEGDGVLVVDEAPAWWGERNGTPTLTGLIYRTLALGGFSHISDGQDR